MIKMKHKDNAKATVQVRDEIQAAAFLNAGFEPATKADHDKLYGVKEELTEPDAGGTE